MACRKMIANPTTNVTPNSKTATIINIYKIHRILSVAVVLTALVEVAVTKMCYSCSGVCHNEHHCNCQMGSCEADYCFIEKRPVSGGAATLSAFYRIVKGCVKRPARTRLGCDYDHFANHVQCICSGDFCNEAITMRRQNPPLVGGRPAPLSPASGGLSVRRQGYYLQFRLPHNVTCRLCAERRRGDGGPGDCMAAATCRGEWCHEKPSTGAAGCGFGPPTLPFFYQGPELLWSVGSGGRKVCTTLSRGNGALHTYCICNTPMCNDAQTQPQSQRLFFSIFSGDESPSNHRSRSVSTPYSEHRHSTATFDDTNTLPLPLYECVNCDLTVEQSVFTSNCKSNRCRGHFCTYATQRVFGQAGVTVGSGGPVGGKGTVVPTVIHERQGCMNVTDARQVQLGCTHKWTTNEEEEIYCACQGDNCNGDLTTAAASAAQMASLTSMSTAIIAIVAASTTLPYHFRRRR